MRDDWSEDGERGRMHFVGRINVGTRSISRLNKGNASLMRDEY